METRADESLLSFEYIDLDRADADSSLAGRYSVLLLKGCSAFPVCIDSQGESVVAFADPCNLFAVNAVREATKGKMKAVGADPQQISSRIEYLLALQDRENAITHLRQGQEREPETKRGARREKQLPTTQLTNAPAVTLVDSLIREAVQMRASDIHIEPFESCVRVRYRIDGELSDKTEIPVSAYSEISARIKIMAEMDIAEKRLPQDGHIIARVGMGDYDIRVSTLPTVHGEKFVLRILDKSRLSFTRDQIGFDQRDSLLVDRLLAAPHGIVLLTGPTGCGKSTTLYAFLSEIKDSSINIVTVEDPVEYIMEGINQTQINPRIDYTFAHALRSILRQDPDVIMVGEIRDEETAQIAPRSAITGHRVFSTLHTNDAPGAITRLVDMGVSSYLVADSLVAVISQRLVKRLCTHCREKIRASEAQARLLGASPDTELYIYKASGCSYCNKTGYRGRIAVHEIMYMTDDIKGAVSSGITGAKELRKIAIENGMRPLAQSCRQNVLDGVTDICEYVKLCADNFCGE